LVFFGKLTLEKHKYDLYRIIIESTGWAGQSTRRCEAGCSNE